MTERTKLLNVRISDDERLMLKQLAEHTGLSQSDAVRQLLRKAHADAGLVLKAKRSAGRRPSPKDGTAPKNE